MTSEPDDSVFRQFGNKRLRQYELAAWRLKASRVESCLAFHEVRTAIDLGFVERACALVQLNSRGFDSVKRQRCQRFDLQRSIEKITLERVKKTSC